MNHSTTNLSNQKGNLVEKKIKCPACKQLFTLKHYFPENIEARQFYSDGQTDVSNITQPAPIISCKFCSFIFYVEKAIHDFKHKESAPPESFSETPVNPLGKTTKLKDYLLFLRRGISADCKEELSARKHMWWLLNNTRAEQQSLDHCLEEIWRENIEKMLRIIEQKSVEAPLFQAELLRNLGFFDKCLRTLQHLNNNNHKHHSIEISNECLKQNPYRIELKHKEKSLVAKEIKEEKPEKAGR